MRLLTHNYLQSNVKGTEKGFPLTIRATTVIREESEMDRELLTNILPKLDYETLLLASRQLAQYCSEQNIEPPDIPDELPSDPIDDETLAALHIALFDLHVLEGVLVCPDTGREFPIKQGIPNMILHEDEI